MLFGARERNEIKWEQIIHSECLTYPERKSRKQHRRLNGRSILFYISVLSTKNGTGYIIVRNKTITLLRHFSVIPEEKT
jgi:hypothetical protein